MTKKATKSKKPTTTAKGTALKKFVWALVGVILLSFTVIGWELYQQVYRSNVSLDNPEESSYLEIPTGSDFPMVLEILRQKNILRDITSFEWVARQLGYPEKVKPGRYPILKGDSNFDIVRMLAAGRQEPVKLIINRFRSREDFFGAVGRKLEADSAELAAIFSDDTWLRTFGLLPEESFAVIIPNTYELYWNTNGKEFFERMYKEYQSFWTQDRRVKAKNLGLNEVEVMKLASIVDEETNKEDEKDVIAGVYLNRLKIAMPLQADPTVRFAHNDFSIKRVTGVHLRLKSPYNTYQVIGLPPGPICTPSIASIDAVLNAEKHTYLYFCAKEDFSGYHRFATTYPEHQKNARLYQMALENRKIY